MVKKMLLMGGFLGSMSVCIASDLPSGFVYLHDLAPFIIQDMRYAGYHNFIGRPIHGYEAPQCILTLQAAKALSNVEAALLKSHLTLKVYDCYRPQRAVDDFIKWSQDPSDQLMKNEFYPRVNKKDFFTLGYVAAKSGHTRGSTVDLTIVPLPAQTEPVYHSGEPLTACFAPVGERFRDNSINMGTGFDCMDETAHTFNASMSKQAKHNRMLLRSLMVKYGFEPYNKEWWHFTLKDEPYPNTYFNFVVK